VLKGEGMTIMGIVAQVDFEIIYLVDRGKTYTFIVERPWGG
jgi:hypothetical protein